MFSLPLHFDLSIILIAYLIPVFLSMPTLTSEKAPLCFSVLVQILLLKVKKIKKE
jgi:hypothetical protein